MMLGHAAAGIKAAVGIIRWERRENAGPATASASHGASLTELPRSLSYPAPCLHLLLKRTVPAQLPSPRLQLGWLTQSTAGMPRASCGCRPSTVSTPCSLLWPTVSSGPQHHLHLPLPLSMALDSATFVWLNNLAVCLSVLPLALA